MYSSATTVDDYIGSLPDERREIVSTVRQQILACLPRGFEEAVNWGMICYQVPLEIYPNTYNKQPLMMAAVANQKNHVAIYLSTPYINETVREDLYSGFARAGKKLDMGKSCIRFKHLEDIALKPILDVIAGTDLASFVAQSQAAQQSR